MVKSFINRFEETPLVLLTYLIILLLIIYTILKESIGWVFSFTLLLIVVAFFRESNILEFFGIKVQKTPPAEKITNEVKEVEEKEEENRLIKALREKRRISFTYQRKISQLIRKTEKDSIRKVADKFGFNKSKLEYDIKVRDFIFDAMYFDKRTNYFIEVKQSGINPSRITEIAYEFSASYRIFKELYKSKNIKLILIFVDIYTALGKSNISNMKEKAINMLKERTKELIDKGVLEIVNIKYSMDELEKLLGADKNGK